MWAAVLPDEYLTAVKQELRQRLAIPDSGEAERLRRALERWKRLFVLGEIDEERVTAETVRASLTRYGTSTRI